MEGYGLEVTSKEKGIIIGYLSKYMGPSPASSSTEKPSKKIDGRDIYFTNCVGCHQSNGKGFPGVFPPLKGNPMLFKDDYPILVVLFGLSGPIEVAGKRIDNTMPSLSHLTDAEIAAVVNFIRRAWGNIELFEREVTPDDVARYRKKNLSKEDVYKYRSRLK